MRARSLRTKMVAAFAAVLGLGALLLIVWLPARIRAVEERWSEHRAVALALAVARSVEPGLDFGDTPFINDRLSVLETAPDARSVVVLGETGDDLGQWGARIEMPPLPTTTTVTSTPFGDQLLLVSIPLRARGGSSGWMRATFDQAEIDQHYYDNLALTAAVLGFVWLIGTAVSWVLGTVLIRPLRELTDAARGFGREEGEEAALPNTGGQDEVAVLSQSFQAMFERIIAQVTALEREKRRALDAEVIAVRASNTKSQFLANMSHELRTPLNAIIGYAEMVSELADELSPEQIRADLAKSLTAARHLLSLINDILDLSKIEAQRLELMLESYDVGATIRSIADEVAPLVTRKNNQLQLQIAPDIGCATGDITRVRQCLLNLISNASKFTEHGIISLSVHQHEGWVQFEIRDTGIGIAPEHLPKLFEPFVQADATTTRRYGGTGLGLALTRRLCELMGGTITLTSTLGVGTTVTIRLPVEGPTVKRTARSSPARVSSPGTPAQV